MRCQICHTVIDAAAPASEDAGPPADGDVAICVYCGATQIFENGELRNPTDDELAELVADKTVQAARRRRL